MLCIRDLVKVYPGPVAALQGIRLDIPRGMFGLLGPNGAGKTTLMRIVAGLLEATSGEVTLDGEDLLSRPERIWSRLGYLPQEFGFYPHLTGEQMLTYLLRLKGVDAPGGMRSLCRSLLEQVNLEFAARRKVGSYSGWMRQRLGVAQAIAGNPGLIIVDEPTAGLDPEERLRLYRILAELAQDRIVLLSTHIVEDVGVLCSHFAVIRRGTLVTVTTPGAARSAIEGMIYEGEVAAADLDALRGARCVTQAILVEGRNRVRVYEPGGGRLPRDDAIGERLQLSGEPVMSFSRLRLMYNLELAYNSRRPLLWFLVVMLVLTSWGLSQGDVQIQSGNSAVGGTKAWITSEFANGKLFAMTIFLFYSLFIAVAAGMSVMRDEELKVGEVLHSTPLRPSEYVWGKLLAIVTAFLAVLGIHLLSAIFFNHVLPNAKAIELRGPFHPISYLRPMFVFGLPGILFTAGTAFAIGERSRKPILVFVLPVAVIIACAFFLWNWTPSWLDPRIDRVLMWADLGGVRWLSQTWLTVDRGVDFYNHAPITYDTPFLLSRLVFVLLGFGAVVLAERHFRTNVRGAWRRRLPKGQASATSAAAEGGFVPPETSAASPLPAPLSTFRMTASAPGLVRGVWDVLRFELRELKSQPGLYLFVPIILLQTLGTCLVAVGAFDTPVLITPGTIAVRSMNTLTLLVCLLTLFYTVESLRRERNTGLFSVYYATPVRTTSVLFGKVLANTVVGLVVVLGTFVGAAIALLIQGKVAIDLRPFLLVWGVLLIPTFLLWASFTTFIFALTNNRYVTYGLALGVLCLTGILQMLHKMNWAGNWDLWGVLLWSDLGTFELNRSALLLNRIAALGGCVFFTAATVAIFPRSDRDATRLVHRLALPVLGRRLLRLVPYAVVPLVTIVVLAVQVGQGFQGKAELKKEKDYWRQNLATWKDAPLPSLTHVDLSLDLDPPHRGFRTEGRFDLVNGTDQPMAQVALTGGPHWVDVGWTMNGTEYKPEDRSRLFVFTPPAPLAPGDSVHIGFHYHGRFPKGMTKNGGGTMEFILPSGAVLTSFSPSFVPVLGYQEGVGIDKDNKYEPRVYPADYYKGKIEPALGTGATFTTRIRITAPSQYTLNSVGTLVSESDSAGRRVALWQSDQPVRFFNVVAGKWKVRRDEGTAIFYSPRHPYNVEEMSEALGAARRYYSEWFAPYPWRELKLSEFAANAFYAQGFPTDISFSEGIGFLTKSDPKTNLAFMVTAHESAHQWWGNMLTPGKGPGGDILSEGMAHFSTILLMEQVKGLRARIEFCKRIEEQYGNNRQVDSERPLVKIDGSRTGDQAVTYNKGGWVFWMLLNRMGRERALAGIQEFIRKYKDGPDYPLLEDLVETLRPFAPDSASYNDFTRQWFFDVVVPEYRITDAKRAEEAVSDTSSARSDADSSARDSGASRWTVHLRLKNAGKGRMPVEVAAVSGERFEKDGSASAKYRDARTTVILGAGDEADVTIPCGFKPDRVLVDPDALVLQLERKAAVFRF
jgi:ABC-2 type transport system permease protein